MNQPSLFEPSKTWEIFDVPDADLRLLPSFLHVQAADHLLNLLIKKTIWKQHAVKFFEKEHPLPRLQQWYGSPGLTYSWSGLKLEPDPWPDYLLDIRDRVSEVARCSFNTVLLNLYRNGKDTVGWHSDDEKDMGVGSTVASISLGAVRPFVLRHKTIAGALTINMPHGSLLIMAGTTQAYWQHSLPRRAGILDPRVNLTFRTIIKST